MKLWFDALDEFWSYLKLLDDEVRQYPPPLKLTLAREPCFYLALAADQTWGRHHCPPLKLILAREPCFYLALAAGQTWGWERSFLQHVHCCNYFFPVCLACPPPAQSLPEAREPQLVGGLVCQGDASLRHGM